MFLYTLGVCCVKIVKEYFWMDNWGRFSGVTSLDKTNKTELKTILNSLLICLFCPTSGYESNVWQLSENYGVDIWQVPEIYKIIEKEDRKKWQKN